MIQIHAEYKALKDPYHMTFFNVLGLRKPLWIVSDLSDLNLGQIRSFQKMSKFSFFQYVCVLNFIQERWWYKLEAP